MYQRCPISMPKWGASSWTNSVGQNYHTYNGQMDRPVPLVTQVTNGAPLFDDSPMGLYDYLIDHLTTTLAAAPLVDLTLYFELALI
jgi:hypothetical protein